MTTDFQNVEIPRDRWGRPMVLPARGTRRVAYRRTTTFVGCREVPGGSIRTTSTATVTIRPGNAPLMVVRSRRSM